MTEGVVIRAFDLERDLARWVEINSDPVVARDVLQIPFTSADEWRVRLQSQGVRRRTIVAEIDGEVIGGLSMSVYEGRRAHVGTLGMAVDKRAQGQGVGSNLMRAALDLADNWYNLHRVELEVYADNARGVALYKKFGFEIEGTLRDYAVRDGVFVDVYAMARFKPIQQSATER